jgi:hypothetical protein
MNRGKQHVQISFDDLNRIRILDAEHFKQTEGLAEECTHFNESTCRGNEEESCREAALAGHSAAMPMRVSRIVYCSAPPSLELRIAAVK